MKKIKILFLSLVILIIVLPTITFNTEKNVVSKIDNRMLTELTSYSANNINEYIEDRLGFRSFMINVYNELNAKLFNVSTHPEYIMNDDGSEMFNNIGWLGGYNSYYDDLAISIGKMSEYCKERDIPFIYVFSPAKASVYKELLPTSINYDVSWEDEFFNKLDELGVTYINQSEVLREYSNEIRVFNKYYDTFHWNDTGVFIGTNKILETLKNDIDNINLNTKENFNIETLHESYIPESDYRIDEEVTFYKTKTELIHKEDTVSDLSISEEFKDFIYTQNNDVKDTKLLMFAGSYFFTGNRYEQIASQVHEFIGVHDYQNVFDFDYYVSKFNPDCIVFEMAEYTFQEYYFSQYSMNNINVGE